MAEPAKLAPIGSHNVSLVFYIEHIVCDQAEFMRKLLNVSVVLVFAVAVLVIYLMVRLLWHMDTTIIGIMEV
jgi:hypothetical protein